MDSINALVISTVVPDAKAMGGPLVLDRHLNGNPNILCNVGRLPKFPLKAKIIGKFRQVGFPAIANTLECVSPVLPSERLVDSWLRDFRPQVIITVAHGWWHLRAAQVSRVKKIPLVTFFQDWWPDFADVPRWFRRRVEQQVRETCRASDLVICVSEGMLQELGAPPNAIVLHDIPSATVPLRPTRQEDGILDVVYFGNLQEYGPPLEHALRGLRESTHVRLDVYGPRPRWTPGTESEFRRAGRYHGAVSADSLHEAIGGCDAVLVVMAFDPRLGRRMATSFPSKLIEATQMGMPIVLWGPETCSAVRWARDGDRALCVTDERPQALVQALEALSQSPPLGAAYARKAREAASGQFNPQNIQQQFTLALRQVIGADAGRTTAELVTR